jgi:hypothetical protein
MRDLGAVHSVSCCLQLQSFYDREPLVRSNHGESLTKGADP